MQIRHLKVENFRGIANLSWAPRDNFCCLIGAGDSGKSTILDALDAALNAKWISFSESDFLECDTRKNIKIEVIVGELSKALISDERFGLYIHGWTDAGALRIEPEANDESVLIIRLSVDASLDPVWELVCDRASTPRALSNRDRALFGLIRLAGDDARHLAWGQGSVLSRLTGDRSEVATVLSDVYRSACSSANLHTVQSLVGAACEAETHAKALGAYIDGGYTPGLALGRSSLSHASIALHDGSIPLRLAGLGTRRLATLGIQKSAIKDGAIVLIDEIEHGLEPHRIIGAMSQLRRDLRPVQDATSIGQVLMTTHSDIALGETEGSGLYVVKMSRSDRLVTLRSPQNSKPIISLLRYAPRAMFARRILVAEGMTEVGLLTGISEFWVGQNNGIPMAQRGVAIADGNGDEASSLALALADLGYPVAMFRDSDKSLTSMKLAELTAAKVDILEYSDKLNTEMALLKDANDDAVQSVLDYLRQYLGTDVFNNHLREAMPFVKGKNNIDFNQWQGLAGMSGPELREIISTVILSKKLLKNRRLSRGLAPHAWQIALASPTSPFAVALANVERWIYA